VLQWGGGHHKQYKSVLVLDGCSRYVIGFAFNIYKVCIRYRFVTFSYITFLFFILHFFLLVENSVVIAREIQ
jgi:hypothetical protein